MKVLLRSREIHRQLLEVKVPRVPLVALAISLGFVAGALIIQSIPKTFYEQPILTLRIMKDFPIGTNVLPIDTADAQKQFEQFGWGKEPARIVGYETIKLRGRAIMLCQIRTQRGAGYTLAVNPSWITRPRDKEYRKESN